MKILLVAEEAAGAQALKALGESEHEVAAVLCGRANNGDEGFRGVTVPAVARALGYTIMPAERVKDPDFAQDVARMGVDVLLNVHSLHIVRAHVLDAVNVGAFNVHPGPLPEYAGMNTPSWAVLNGEKQHGVTLHWMTAGIDEGDVAYQERFDLTEQDTGLTVSAKCARLGLQLIKTLLSQLHQDATRVPKLVQDLSKRRYFGRHTPFQGKVQWSMNSEQLDRFVRACDYFPLASPLGYPVAKLNGRSVGLMKVSRTRTNTNAEPGSITEREGNIWLATRDEWLAVHKVQLDGKPVDARTVLRVGEKLV